MENCPFCEKTKADETFITETEYWKVFNNIYPFYEWVKHILVVPKKHVLISTDLSEEELMDFKNVEVYLRELFWDDFYFSFTRHSLWNRKVQHMHYHYIKWNPQDITIDWVNYLEIK